MQLWYLKQKLFKIYHRLSKSTFCLYRPPTIHIEPTARCNMACFKCERNYGAKGYVQSAGFMPEEIFAKTFPFIKTAYSINLSGFGEPFLHPQYLDMIAKTRELNNKAEINIYTNGTLLDAVRSEGLVKNRVNVLHVSLDGATNATNQMTRQGNVEEIFDKIKLLNEIKRKKDSQYPRIRFNFGFNNENIKELPQLVGIAQSLKVAAIDLIQLHCFSESMKKLFLDTAALVASLEYQQAARQARQSNVQIVTPQPSSGCLDPFKMLMISWEGFVMPCYMEEHIVGNLQHESLEEIWNNEKIRNLRRALLYGQGRETCRLCNKLDDSNNYQTLPRSTNSRFYSDRHH
ncbi:MAG: SPASM domain-containing protein [Candidatus Omnitrophica bacterium]|nr:SPASM domain-containing protein [Candidatus Omnitrophota bacterium]